VNTLDLARTDQNRSGLLERFGTALIDGTLGGCRFIGDYWVVLGNALIAGNWRRSMRREFARSLYEIGFKAIIAVLVAAVLVAAGLVLQVIYWLELAGQEGRIGEFLVLLLVNQIAPITTGLIILGRSGAVLLDEIGELSTSGHIRLLQSHGISTEDLIIVPCCSAAALAAFLLTQIFVHAALWCGYAVASLTGLSNISALDFFTGVLANMSLKDHLLLVIKPLLIGFSVAFLAIWFGLRVERNKRSVRHQLPVAFVISLTAIFAINGALSLL